MLLHKVLHGRNNIVREVIGLVGTHHGAGVTHTGLMLAFYLGEELGKKTAFLECNNHQDLSLLQHSYEWSEEEADHYSYQNVTLFKSVISKQIPDIFSDEYECCVLDFGTGYSANREEFLRCDRKVVVGDRADWNKQKLIRFIETVKAVPGYDTWNYLIPFASHTEVKELRKRLFMKNLMSVPFHRNPIELSKDINVWMRKSF